MVLQPFAAIGNRLHPKFWVVTGDPRYPGYLTPTVAYELSVEWVARAGHSIVGRTCTHMLPWALSQDSTVKASTILIGNPVMVPTL
jgi:hypothetical protein